jgi:prepilin-type processing-associated H-X9-DG protein
MYPSFPLMNWGGDSNTLAEPRQSRRVSKIRYPSELLFIYDGFWTNSLTANRYSHRHHQWTTANIGYADGHAEAVKSDRMPDWVGDSNWWPEQLSNPIRYGFRIWDDPRPHWEGPW